MKVNMRYKKFLITSVSLISAFSSYAACSGNDCFNQGVDFGNQAKPSASVISNSTLESAVGSNNISQANAMQDSIQQTMGGNYKNIDGITNAGNNKAQACVGKDTAECKAYNYYNDPLTRLSQQGVESAVGVASKLINKKIEQNVDLASYCSSHPDDTTCKMCRDDPSQAMCQQGNKCTTISYTTGDNRYVTNGCQIIGQRSYECDKWIDNVISHMQYIPPNPLDGTVVGSGSTRADACDGAWTSGAFRILSYSYLTQADMIYLSGTVSGNGACGGVVTRDINMNISLNGINSRIYSLDQTGCDRGRWDNGNFIDVSGGCSGSSCSYKFDIKAKRGGVGNRCKQEITQSFTLNFTKPQLERYERVVDQVVWKDNCSR